MPFPSSLPAPLARLHAWARAQAWLGRFTLANRLLLAMAFLPTGLVKVMGLRFTLVPITEPVGFFFEAMYRTGPYWRFIGAMQILAAILVLVPATATLGALLFLPIALSILLITWGVDFAGTVYVAAGMVLSATYLICWDADRIWSAFSRVVGASTSRPLLEDANRIERAGWILGGLVGVAFFLNIRGIIPRSFVDDTFYAGLVALTLVVLGWIVAIWRQHRRQPD